MIQKKMFWFFFLFMFYYIKYFTSIQIYIEQSLCRIDL